MKCSLHFILAFTVCISTRLGVSRILAQTVKAKMKCNIISCISACKDKTIIEKKEYTDTVDMYNGLSQVYCIIPEGRIHQYTKD